MKNFYKLVQRECRLFLSNKIMMILYLGGPVLYAILFGAVYTKGKLTNLPVIVIDKDQSPLSTRLTDMLEESDVLAITGIRQEGVDLDKVFMHDDAYAVISIPYNFESDVLQARHPEVNTYINNGNLLAAGYVIRAVTAVAGTLNAMKTVAAGKSPEAFHLNTFRLFNRSSNYFMFIWPSYLAIILQSVVMVVLALSMASETEQAGKLAQLYQLSGRSAWWLLASKLTPYWTLSVFILLIYSVYFIAFQQPFPDHPLQVLFITALFIATNSFLGIIAGLIFKSQLRSLQFLMILSLPVYISSGFSWPFDQDGLPAQLFSILFPFMAFVNGLRVLLIEHGTLYDIRDYLAIQAGQLLLYFAMAWGLLRLRVKRS